MYANANRPKHNCHLRYIECAEYARYVNHAWNAPKIKQEEEAR